MTQRLASGNVAAFAVTKNVCRDLALFGGSPAFPEAVHVGRPNVGDRGRFLQRMNDILDRRWLTNDGPIVKEFEQQVAGYLGVRHCVAMCNGTIALEIAARALGLRGEVIVPSFTFVASAHCLQWQEITPVFCDIDPDTHTLDPRQVERLITPRTSGILGVHVWGRPCAVTELQSIAEQHDLRLFYDASHAFGCSFGGQMIGNFGDAETFSFHATKFVNSFEGGAVTTNDDELAERMRLMRNFGFTGLDKVTYIGINGKMNEASAAMGLTSFEAIDRFIEKNRRNHSLYRRELARVPGVRLLRYDEDEASNYQYVVLEIDEKDAGISRDHLVRILEAENVRARRYFHPGVHRMEPYRSYYPDAGLLLTETERVCARVIVLPTGTAVDEQDILRVAALIQFAVKHSDQLHELLAERDALTSKLDENNQNAA